MTLATMPEIIQQMRDFHRFYTGLLGPNEAPPLPEGLSPTEARILETLAQGEEGLTARHIMRALGLDAGYLSRLLKGFEARKLIARTRSRRDRRAVLLALTPRGAALAATLEAQAQTQLRPLIDLLDPAGQQAVIAAMRQIQAQFAPARRMAPLLIRELRLGDAGWIIHRHGTLIAQEQGWDMRFEALVATILADFIRDYDSTFERSWIAERDGQILGSLFLTRADAFTARLRLLYIEKAARGMGLATKLLEKAMQFARDKNYQQIRLFTTSENVAARRIYERLGFVKLSEEPTDLFGSGLIGETWERPL